MPWILPAFLGLALAATLRADEARTHVLHLGADFSIAWRGEARPVVAVRGEEFVIEVDGREVALPREGGPAQIRMDAALKLTDRSANLTGLKGEPAFTAANNPYRSSEMAVALAQGAEAVSDQAVAQLRAAEVNATYGRADGTVDPYYKEQLAAAQQQYQDSLHAQNTVRDSVDLPGHREVGAAYDAFLLSFTVSAPNPLGRPYAVVVVHHLAQPGNPKTARVLVFGQALARVDATPRQVHVLRGGLPPGYQLERFAVHLYDRGQEIATNVSSRRVELTTDEAFQYALVEHLANPRTETQPPMPARDFWPADLVTRLVPDNRNRLVYVQVNPEGRITGVFHDPDGRLPIKDADIAAVLPELRFLPALDRGKPVPGVCRVSLGDLAL